MIEQEKVDFETLMKKREENEVDFERLLEPYREGGTAEQPIRRTWGTLITWLSGKLRFTPEIIGAAILLVCLEMKKGKLFNGDGSYGSKGRELAHYLKNTCLAIKETRSADDMFMFIGKKIYTETIAPMMAEKMKKMMKPWWRRIF